MKAHRLLALLALQACASVPERPTYRGRYCDMVVPPEWSFTAARSFGIGVDEVIPKVAAHFALERIPRVEVHLVSGRFVDEEENPGRFLWPPARIEIGSVCLEEAGELQRVIAHELVHAYIAEEGWLPLPCVVQEVLAEFVANQIVGKSREELLGEALETSAGELEFLLGLSRDDVSAYPPEERKRMGLAGLALLKRLGWPRLLEMLRAGESSNAELLRAFRNG